MGTSVSPVDSNIFVEHTNREVHDTEQHTPPLGPGNVHATYVDWPHGPDRLRKFFSHINNLRSSIQFTTETELFLWIF
jgi:hypothetical protein